MSRRTWLLLVLTLMICGGLQVALFAQDTGDQDEESMATTERIQVTATRIPEAVEPEPASITIVTGDQLRETGANDLSSALALVGGISIAPGGDGGPASSVPEFWGLREFDAFLLVVDDVPWGGAFTPSLASLDLNNIERIEILRGAAPVMYGATSFVGVIHVIHRAASAPGTTASAYGGNFSSGGGAVRLSLPGSESWKHSLSANFDSQGFKDDRTNYDRGHVLYRGETGAEETGLFRLDADLTFLRQDPASPHPRSGRVLSTAVPLDSNHNPSDSQHDENRFHFVGSYKHPLLGSNWSVLAALTHAERDITRGFLTEVSDAVDPNAAGYRQNQDETDLYFDTHFAWKTRDDLKFIAGADHLYGKGEQESENFDYFVPLNGFGAPSSHDQPIQEETMLEDERNFFGLYGQMEWNPTSRWLIQAGLRFNSTHETREGEAREPGEEEGGPEEGGKDSQTNNRLSGAVGVSYLVLSQQENSMWLFGNYRNSFKPAVIDFGPEAEGEILKPETGESFEVGVKGENMGGRFEWDFTYFHMDMKNLVTSTVVNGLPALINSGKQRFQGVELETEVELDYHIRVQGAYSYHSAKFVDFVQAFDGVPTQLAGKKLEMSPDHLASAGILYMPPNGLNGSFLFNYVGERFLTKRNTAIADSYVTMSLGIGYRFGQNNVRFDIKNLNDARDPVSESELGDAQYYRLPARQFRFGWQYGF